MQDLVIGKQDTGREFIEIVFNTILTDKFLKNFTDKLFCRLPHFREFMYKSTDRVYIEVMTPSNLHIGYNKLKDIVADAAGVAVVFNNATVDKNGVFQYWRVNDVAFYWSIDEPEVTSWL